MPLGFFIWNRAHGCAEGLAEGEKKAKIEIALQLKEQGLSVEAIVACTGLSIEEIQML